MHHKIAQMIVCLLSRLLMVAAFDEFALFNRRNTTGIDAYLSFDEALDGNFYIGKCLRAQGSIG